MHNLHTVAGAIHGMQVFASAFLAILFLQSGIDKVVDRRGNLEWLKGHFAKSPLTGFVPAMVTIITLLELVAGGLRAGGGLFVFFCRGFPVALFLAGGGPLPILCLFFRARVGR